jgi:UDP-N-acetylmuramoyl-L-alanyl-D-glutamate--2,6-diaminopimelate ligase
MTLGELMGPEAPLPAPWLQVPIMGLTADSRAVKPGYLFAALPGSRTDGAYYIADALARGAAAHSDAARRRAGFERHPRGRGRPIPGAGLRSSPHAFSVRSLRSPSP